MIQVEPNNTNSLNRLDRYLSPDARSTYHRIQDELRPHFEEFVSCGSTEELLAHPSYQRLSRCVEEVLLCVDQSDFERRVSSPAKRSSTSRGTHRVVAWNLERGIEMNAQLEVLKSHPYIKDADVYLLTEVDVGMARSGNRAVAQELAEKLGLSYAFAPCYLNLSKGAGVEFDSRGMNELGLHGNAILSRHPIRKARAVRLQNGKDKMRGREKRLGNQTAIAALVELPEETIQLVSVHLDAQSTQRHRRDQMRDILVGLEDEYPTIIGGDWNTTTHNSSSAIPAIMGYWLRVFMGIDRSIRHYLHPYRWFERELFSLLETEGFDFRESNLLGDYTMSYQAADEKTRKNLGEWVPGWCFAFIRWALRNHDGRCPLRVDWLATRGLDVSNPTVWHEFREGRETPLSDHDVIGLDFVSNSPNR